MSTQVIDNLKASKKSKIVRFLKISKYVLLVIGAILPFAVMGIAYLDISIQLSNVDVDIVFAILSVLCAFIIITVAFPAIFGIFSFLHILQLCLTTKTLKNKAWAIIFRILTVLFGVASIVFSILLLTKHIPIYDYLRSVVLFFGGSIVLNLAVE